MNDDLPKHVLVNSVSSPYFDLTWLLNLTGASVLTREKAFAFSYCVNINSPAYRELYQMPPVPDDFDYIDACLKKLGL